MIRKPLTSNLRNGTIVPYVAFVWENIGDVSQLALLHILLYWVQQVFCCDLKRDHVHLLFLNTVGINQPQVDYTPITQR